MLHLVPQQILSFTFALQFICLQSECLKEVFSELDTSSEVLEMLISPEAPYFRLSTFGNSGSTQVFNNRHLLMLDVGYMNQ